MQDVTQLSATELREGYLRGDFTPVEVVDAYLASIKKKNPELNAYLEVFDDAHAAAEAATARIKKEGEASPVLCGVPIAIKDNILIKGKKVSAASKMLENYVATYNATVIKKLGQQGVVFLGRTNMDEFAMGSSTENSAFGPTKNPCDTSRVPGGSSGGSAAAVAAHLAPIALGSDTGGSIRQPASFCGLYGLKPTYGAASRSGLIAMGSSLDQIGPLARSIDDIESVFYATRGKDPLDATTISDDTYPHVVVPKKLKIGIPRTFISEGVDADVKKAFDASLEKLRAQGHEIVDIELPRVSASLAVYYIVMPAEVSTNLARLDGMRYGLHVNGPKLLDDYKLSRREGFGPETRRRILLGTYVLSSGYYDAYYRSAIKARALITEDFTKALAQVDVIATPTTPTPAFKFGEKKDPLSMYLADIFTISANLTGMPALSAPMGTAEKEGKQLPLGIQFSASHGREDILFQAARELGM